MLRMTVLLLLLANGVFFAWSQGLLAGWGRGPVQQSEPQRLERQIRPQALRILSADEAALSAVGAASAAAPAPGPAQCLRAGPLQEDALAAVRPVLRAWPAESWRLQPVAGPARWIVYMGPYPSADSVARKQAQLRQLGVSFEALSDPALEPGLSLGGFATQAAADQHLQRLTERGVRTARVVQEGAATQGQLLTLPAVDGALQPRLDALRAALDRHPLQPCR